MRRRSGPRDSRLRTDENSHLPPNQSPLISPRQLITLWGGGKKCDLEVHFFLNTVRTIGRGGKKKSFPTSCKLPFFISQTDVSRGAEANYGDSWWDGGLLHRHLREAERLCPPPCPRISAGPRSQTWFFLAMISFAFLFCFFFPFPASLFFFFFFFRCLKAPHLKSPTMSAACSVNFQKSPQKSCGENQCNHPASCCFDAITEKKGEKKKKCVWRELGGCEVFELWACKTEKIHHHNF